MNPIIVPPETLQRFCADCFVKLGVKPEPAGLTAANLVFANLRGVDSHGVIRLKIYCDRLKKGGFRAHAVPEIVSDKESTALIDGQGGLGQVTAMRAMKLALQKAEKTGAAFVATRNSNHFGACAFYAMQGLDAGLIGLAASYWWIDVKGHLKHLDFFTIVGMNSIFIYLFFEIVGGRWLNGYVGAITNGIMILVQVPEMPMMIITSLCIFGLEWGMCYFLYRKKIFLRL